jgi:hypothetical protein
VYVIMHRKNERTYLLMLKLLFELAQTRLNIRANEVAWASFSIDFESAMWNALRAIELGGAFSLLGRVLDIVGCHFHFAQAIIRQIQELGLMETYTDEMSGLQNYVSMLLALAFIPAEYVWLSYTIIRTNLVPDAPFVSTEAFRKFCRYFEDQWLCNRIFSICDWNCYGVEAENRTTNALERLHRRYKELFGEHKPLYHFIRKLRIYQCSKEITESQHRHSGVGPNIRTKKVRDKYRVLKLMTERFEAQPTRDIRTVMYFLLQLSRVVTQRAHA